MVTTKKRRIRLWHDDDPCHPRKHYDNFGTMVCWHRRYNLGDEQPKADPREYLTTMAVGFSDRLEYLIWYWENEGYEWLEEKYGYGSDAAIDVSGAHIESLIEWVLDRNILRLPLYLYDHSGITMNTCGFSCPWDSGQVGFIYVTVKDVLENWNVKSLDDLVTYQHDGSVKTARERAYDLLRSEVEVYDQFLTGNIWGFSIEERDCECEEDEDCDDWIVVDSCGGFYGDDPFENGMSDHVDKADWELLRNAEVED